MNDYYSDEPIGWIPPDYYDHEDYGSERWDYVEPDEEPDEEPDWDDSQLPADVPEPIIRLRRMIISQMWQLTTAKSFRKQAQLMAGYTDDADIVDFKCYFPTYRDMTVAELRSYFTLRRMWRQGKYVDAPTSYIFVYVYELLMLVGVSSADEGYQLLRELLRAYGGSKLDRYLQAWLRDYVVYYNLSDRFKEVFAQEWLSDQQAERLADYDHLDDAELVDAACAISRYDIRKKPLFKKQKQKAQAATAFVLRRLLPQIEKHRGHDIVTLCLGQRQRQQFRLFDSAVFYDPKPVMNAEIQVAPRHCYYCNRGLWSRDEYVGNKKLMVSLLGDVLRVVDLHLRNMMGVKPQLKATGIAPEVSAAIAESLKAWTEQERMAEQEREAERRKITIDFSQLGRIRTDANVVMQALTVDEPDSEPETITQPSGPPAPQPEPAVLPTEALATDSPADRQLAFLRLMLSGADWRKWLRDNHIPEGVMVEAINERAMDELGDIVLEDNGDGLHIIDDYRDDVERMVKGQ